MTLAELKQALAAELVCGQDLGVEVESVGAADMMSDVLALSRSGMVLLTGLVNAQVIRTAMIADLRAVVFVRGKRPNTEMIGLAREAGIPLFWTNRTMFEACGLVYVAMTRASTVAGAR